jgi:hypothetical protein
MQRIFFVALGLGMILDVAGASAQGYPFGAGSGDMPWSINQQTTAAPLASRGSADQPRSVDQETVVDPHRDGAVQFQPSPVAQKQQGRTGS